MSESITLSEICISASSKAWESYSGGEFFEPNFLNTNDPVFRRYFPNMKSPVGGVGFTEIAQAHADWHERALICEVESDIPMPSSNKSFPADSRTRTSVVSYA